MNKPEMMSQSHGPDLIRVKVGDTIYTYESSEYINRKAEKLFREGVGWTGLNYLKKWAKMVKKEVI